MFYKLRMALSRFMYGRYGADNLSRAMLILYIIIAAVHFIVSLFTESLIVYIAFSVVLTAIFVISFFRMLSRSIYKRRQENDAYLRLKNAVTNRFKVFFGNIKERDKKYVICPTCKSVIRFPRKKGVHSASCPKCRAGMTVKIR